MVYITTVNNNNIKEYNIKINDAIIIFNNFMYNLNADNKLKIAFLTVNLKSMLFKTNNDINNMNNSIHLNFKTKNTYYQFLNDLNNYLKNNCNDYKKDYLIDNINNTYF